MWAVKWFLAVVMILLVLWFTIENSKEAVTIIFFSKWQIVNLQLWMVIYASFGIGVIFWLLVSMVQVLQHKAEIRRLKKNNYEIQNELDSLRNLPIEDDETGFDIKEET